MAINLVNIVKEHLGGQILNQISNTLGISPSAAQTAIDGAVPAMFSGLLDNVNNSEGAEAITLALDTFNDEESFLDNLGDFFQDDHRNALMASGQGLLSSLFGDKVDGIAKVLGQFSGLGQSASSGLLAMIAPIVMSVLGKQQSQLGLDASGVQKMLMDQKDAISAAMPSELSKAFAQSGLLSQLSDAVESGVNSAVGAGKRVVTDITDTASDAASGAVNTVQEASGGGLWKKIYHRYHRDCGVVFSDHHVSGRKRLRALKRD